MRPTRRRTNLVVLLVTALTVATVGYAAVAGGLVVLAGWCPEDFLPLGLADESPATGPYVQDVSTTSAALLWWSGDPVAATVSFQEPGAAARTIPVTPARRQEIVLIDLRPATRYGYRVTTEAGAVWDGTFRTAPEATATVTVGVFGDSGDGSGRQRRVAALLADLEPDLVLHTGDVVYPHGALCRYDDRFFEPYAALLAAAPVYPAIGNHDLEAAGGAAYFDVFRVPAATSTGGERFYAFDYGPVRFVVLDGEVVQPGGDPALAALQAEWLAAELAANRGRLPWTIAVLHRPAVTSAEIDAGANAVRDTLVPLLAAGGADLVLSGHVHAYERSVPIDGVTYVVTGGGGAKLHDVVAGGEIAVARSILHALRLTISPTELIIEAVSTDGTAFDRHTLAQARTMTLPPRVTIR